MTKKTSSKSFTGGNSNESNEQSLLLEQSKSQKVQNSKINQSVKELQNGNISSPDEEMDFPQKEKNKKIKTTSNEFTKFELEAIAKLEEGMTEDILAKEIEKVKKEIQQLEDEINSENTGSEKGKRKRGSNQKPSSLNSSSSSNTIVTSMAVSKLIDDIINGCETMTISQLLQQQQQQKLLEQQQDTWMKIQQQEKEWEEEGYIVERIKIPEHCVPIRADVRDFKFKELASMSQFDVIVMDPPWQLASRAPTRGVALGYDQLPNKDILELPIPLLQQNGFIFIWVINSRYSFALQMMKHWGYKYLFMSHFLLLLIFLWNRMVDDISWVKSTVNRRLAKGHGFYLQHAKETCLVGKKGADPPGMRGNCLSDVIFAERRGQSQKPEELYEMIEQFIPNGNYLEIFARRNNLRNYWVSIGLEL